MTTPDPGTLFHPETIARTRAHQRNCNHNADTPCPAQPDPEDLEQIWAGRARMARARKTAGVPLDRIDQEALKKYPNPCPSTTNPIHYPTQETR